MALALFVFLLWFCSYVYARPLDRNYLLISLFILVALTATVIGLSTITEALWNRIATDIKQTSASEL